MMSSSRPSRRARSGTAVKDIAALHRTRFLRQLCNGRTALILGGDAKQRALLTESAAAVVKAPVLKGRVDLLLDLDLKPAGELLATLPELLHDLPAGGIIALVCRDTPLGSEAGLVAALATRFARVLVYRQRPLVGTLLSEAALEGTRVVALADAPAGAVEASILIASAAPLQGLAGGLFEAVGAQSTGTPTTGEAPPAPTEVRLADLPLEGGCDEDALELRRRAVTLVERLLAKEQQTFALREEIGRMRARLADSGSSHGEAAFDVPRTRYGWPLAEGMREAADLEFYDHRPDDPVVLEGHAGAAFFERFGLGSDAPDFAGAVAALNALSPTLPLVNEEGVPDVSVIIPLYGQLAYTLNCIDSLFRHATRQRVEIIVVDDVSPDCTCDFLPQVHGLRYHRQPVNGGFIQSCNTGMAKARGRYVLFLNNDTRVVAGWLDALVDNFAAFPNAGLVGSKLLYPDGVLQEAGGILWRNGAAWNYGRNDDPNRPQYCHARQVDYVSGASIMLPTALCRELGGFDMHYRPAYAEDADLALRVRYVAGREVWYQPASRLVHYEGKTSGTDTGTGVKAYQVLNTKKLFLRWREQLTVHRPNGQTPYFERERGVCKRVLVVDATTPTPNQDAGSVTVVLTMRLFQQLDYKVYFVPQDNFLYQREPTEDLQRTGIECAYEPFETDFESYIRRYGHLFDVIVVVRVPVLEKVIDDLHKYAPQAPILFHNMDLHYLRMERQAALEGDPEEAAAAAALKKRELDLINRADCTITPSTFERDILATAAPDASVVMWPFMFEFHGTEVGFAARRDICFLGGYRHAPNIDAVEWFVKEIFPRIKRKEPEARFIIAGANPGPEVQALAREDVIVTGQIADLRELFDRTRVFACSLRFGAGVKGKLSTSMSYGLPIVSTACGAEGMDLVDGEEVLLADDPAEFAAACLRLYRDGALWRRLSQAGQDRVREKHSLAMGQRVLQQALEVGFRHQLGLPVSSA